MRTTLKAKAICPFCGQERVIEHWSDDGVDYLGHGRGTPDNGVIDEGCSCPLGKLEQQKVTIKPMCVNCRYQEHGDCVNKELVHSISEMFDIGNRVAIKQLQNVCKYYKLDEHIFQRILK